MASEELFLLDAVAEQLRGEEKLRHIPVSHGDEPHLGTFYKWHPSLGMAL